MSAAQPASAQPASVDQRRSARIETSIFCGVATAATTFDAEVVNLSLGGAGLKGPPAAAAQGDAVILLLEHEASGTSLSLQATVVRTAPPLDERVLYGLRFEPLPPDVHTELVRLLRVLAEGRGAGRRETPRVSTRIDVTCTSEDTFRAVLNDLSRGGFSVVSSTHLTPGEWLRVRFGIEGLPELLDVRGPVVSSFALGEGRYRLGVQFEPLSESALQRVTRLLDLLLGLGPRQGVIVEDEESPVDGAPPEEDDEEPIEGEALDP